jgi:hypothetical protein
LSSFVLDGVQQAVLGEDWEQQDDSGFTSRILVALLF